RKEGIQLGDMAVIYRTNIQARSIVETLLSANIPFCLRDGMSSLYEQWITKDILCYLHLANNLNELEYACKIINKPKRYISKANIEIAKKEGSNLLLNLLQLGILTQWQNDYIQELLFDLQVLKEKSLIDAIRYIRHHIGYDSYLNEYANYRKMPSLSLFEVLEDIEDSAQNYQTLEEWENALKEMSQEIKDSVKRRNANVLTLTTMHGAKGLEFDTVFIIDVVEGIIPYHKSNLEEEIEEERRLLYVGMTRAKKQLYLYIPTEKHGKPVAPSSFIQNLKETIYLEELKKDKIVYHKNLGRGRIVKVLENGIIEVQFNNGEKRKIDSIYCINNAIITWEGDDHEKK
ncbi:MAG: ATP-dependent helicase, partial [Candidatus Cellulosilyticum pullistercoris]|nr:ATP-dependent helicase [Candidatus Cellulosilyticum pullistercoris]